MSQLVIWKIYGWSERPTVKAWTSRTMSPLLISTGVRKGGPSGNRGMGFERIARGGVAKLAKSKIQLVD